MFFWALARLSTIVFLFVSLLKAVHSVFAWVLARLLTIVFVFVSLLKADHSVFSWALAQQISSQVFLNLKSKTNLKQS